MDHFGGLDVSVKETSICIVDYKGRIVKERELGSEPAARLKVLGNPTYASRRLDGGKPAVAIVFRSLAEAAATGDRSSGYMRASDALGT